VANSWYRYTFSLEGTDESQFVIFEAVSKYGNNIYIDDVTVEDPTATIPFTEGFEAGNAHSTAIADWTQAAVSGTSQWTANASLTDYNRTPKTGSWNAFLQYNNTHWMFKPIYVTPETTYKVSVYARQDGAYPANASIGISYGAADNAAAMTNVILAPTGIINGDYQLLEGTFTPDETGIQYVGILGSINASTFCISIDDIVIDVAYDYPADTPIVVGEGEDAVTITVSGGSANNVPGGEIPAIPNGTFVSAEEFVLELLGAGPWTVTIETDAPWGAYYKGGSWFAVENVGGFITFEIEASKDLPAPIILGPVDPTLPVTLSSYTAVLTSEMFVNLQWVAESEVDHAGYNVLRSEVKELSTAIYINTSLIDEGQNVGTQVRYNFLDKGVCHDATYYYWLENLALNGETEYYGPITIYVTADGEGSDIPEIPVGTKLFAAFPNPFNPATNLRYSMKEAGEVRIDIYNLKGQILKTYHNSHNLPGYYQVNWDGRDLNGRPVSTGVYFYRMTSGNYSSTKKMVMAK